MARPSPTRVIDVNWFGARWDKAGQNSAFLEDCGMTRDPVVPSALASLVLAACVTVPSRFVSIGPDTYSLNMAGPGLAAQDNTNIEALAEASDFCERQGKKMLPKDRTENAVYGRPPRRADLTFQCLSAHDPAYLQAGPPATAKD
jgi:hypothetical protein